MAESDATGRVERANAAVGRRHRRRTGDTLVDLLTRKIVGQPAALQYIAPYVQMYQAGLAPPDRPAGIFLLLGPTGTGKTRTVEALAEVLHGSPEGRSQGRLRRVSIGSRSREAHRCAAGLSRAPRDQADAHAGALERRDLVGMRSVARALRRSGEGGAVADAACCSAFSTRARSTSATTPW